MKLNVVPARTGLLWVREGIQVVARQPLLMVGLFVMEWSVLGLLSAVPMFNVVAMVLLPAAAVGYMVATSDVSTGKVPRPSRLLAGFRQGRERTRALLVLGALCTALVLLVLLLTSASIPLPEPLPKDDPFAILLSTRNLVAYAIQMPLNMLFCYAAALSHWHGIPVGKSLFFSAIALWKNMGAFTVFSLAWTALTLAASAILTLAYAVAGVGAVLVLLVPAALVLSTMMLASTWFTFRDSFSADPAGGKVPETTAGGAP
ncbi:BPSS1780 family membrane protein [Ramlibacter sp. MMS24-I3-19]|uniref:BPSS1780 family membrane protein n=1 Tax=Ramlibacter sp. MMS24-I3-19 TaxID=3416606 RepID=UPI003D009D37